MLRSTMKRSVSSRLPLNFSGLGALPTGVLDRYAAVVWAAVAPAGAEGVPGYECFATELCVLVGACLLQLKDTVTSHIRSVSALRCTLQNRG